MAKVTARGAGYYDTQYRRAVEEQGEGMAWIDERYAFVAGHIVGSVLDLGCGLGHIADMISDADYLGVDFSEFCIEYARGNIKNPNARFVQADLCTLRYLSSIVGEQFDTVLLLEVLEHLDKPKAAADLALRLARRRVVVTVPRDMPGRAHVWPTWGRADLEELLGELSVCRLFGGDEGDRWWLAVREITS